MCIIRDSHTTISTSTLSSLPHLVGTNEAKGNRQ